MPKRASKKQTSGVTQDGRRNGKKWKGGVAPDKRKPGDKGYHISRKVIRKAHNRLKETLDV